MVRAVADPGRHTTIGITGERRDLDAVTAACAKIEHIGSPVDARVGTQSLTVRNIALTFDVPSHGWYRWDDLYITKNTVGRQAAEAIILWTDVGPTEHARPCGQWWGSPVGGLARWAWQAANKPGTELVSGPRAVTIGGHDAQHVVFTIRKDVGCNPGFFHTWKAAYVGPFWESTEVGDTIRIWLVDVGQKVLYIEADTHARAGADLEEEVDGIVSRWSSTSPGRGPGSRRERHRLKGEGAGNHPSSIRGAPKTPGGRRRRSRRW